jgi:hypothetical protein
MNTTVNATTESTSYPDYVVNAPFWRISRRGRVKIIHSDFAVTLCMLCEKQSAVIAFDLRRLEFVCRMQPCMPVDAHKRQVMRNDADLLWMPNLNIARAVRRQSWNDTGDREVDDLRQRLCKLYDYLIKAGVTVEDAGTPAH